MTRLADQPRPLVWWALQHVSQRYRAQHDARALADWQRILLRRVFYVPKRKLAYVLNAKAASSSLRDLMITLGGGVPRQFIGDTVAFPSPRWPEAMAGLEDPAVYKFTVVRHPVARARSAFVNLFVERYNGFAWRHDRYVKRVGLKLGEDSPTNFDRFLDYVEDAMAESQLYCDVHLRLQTHNLALRHLRYNRIGRYENLQADLAAVIAEAGVADVSAASLAWVNRSKAETTEPTTQQVRRIEAIYAEDYERLGYERLG